MLRVFSISLGCPKNRVDTERALGALEPLRVVARMDEADCVFVNTCAFISPAVKESVRVVMEAVSRLEGMPARKRPLLAVAGCLVGRYGAATLAPDLPEVDLFLDNRELPLWGEKLRNALGLGATWDARPRLLSTGPSHAWLKISDGCRHRCSFCTIPSIRGPLRSTPADDLLREARFLLEQGVRELNLVAQDLTTWGRDMGLKHGLASLLERLLPLPGLARLRLLYLYPSGITSDLLNFLRAAGPPFVPYFDVPLQHAARAVLSRMGRPFAGRPRALVERIRAVFPEASLRTSLIVGFPGESEKDFEELRAFVEQTRFQHLGVFAYQAEEGTPAAALPGQMPDREKQWRRDSLMHLQGEISESLLESRVGQRLELLVDGAHGEWPGLHVGRTWFQAPESDGITYVSGPGVFPGAVVEAEIVEASTYDLVALTDAEP
jgi:tRNA-2-methylthio-N6-dimethylallyladenosine synthase/ribosomal protein S12 methylthiotransferase